MKNELIAQKNPKSPISEIFRTLRTNIQFMNSQKGAKTILVTSTVPEEGKTWISSNLAVTFAQAGKRVVLIDSDMRKGRVHKLFKTDYVPGLSNYLSGIDMTGNINKIDSDDEEIIYKFIKKTYIDNLYIIPSGNYPPNPSELLTSETTIKMLEKLKEVFDVVILDGTPSLYVSDSIILSRIVDSTLIVVEHNVTKKDSLLKVKKAIENVGGKIAGVIVNKMPVNFDKYESTYYYSSTHSKSKDKNRVEMLSNGQKYNLNKKLDKNSDEILKKIDQLNQDNNFIL